MLLLGIHYVHFGEAECLNRCSGGSPGFVHISPSIAAALTRINDQLACTEMGLQDKNNHIMARYDTQMERLRLQSIHTYLGISTLGYNGTYF